MQFSPETRGALENYCQHSARIKNQRSEVRDRRSVKVGPKKYVKLTSDLRPPTSDLWFFAPYVLPFLAPLREPSTRAITKMGVQRRCV